MKSYNFAALCLSIIALMVCLNTCHAQEQYLKGRVFISNICIDTGFIFYFEDKQIIQKKASPLIIEKATMHRKTPIDIMYFVTYTGDTLYSYQILKFKHKYQ